MYIFHSTYLTTAHKGLGKFHAERDNAMDCFHKTAMLWQLINEWLCWLQTVGQLNSTVVILAKHLVFKPIAVKTSIFTFSPGLETTNSNAICENKHIQKITLQNLPTEYQSWAQFWLRISSHRDQTNLQDLAQATPLLEHYTCHMVQSNRPVEFHLQNEMSLKSTKQNIRIHKNIWINRHLLA